MNILSHRISMVMWSAIDTETHREAMLIFIKLADDGLLQLHSTNIKFIVAMKTPVKWTVCLYAGRSISLTTIVQVPLLGPPIFTARPHFSQCRVL